MSVFTPEIPTVFGTLDSTAIADGEVPSAHALRSMLRAANRLICMGEPLFNFIWDVSDDVTDIESQPEGALVGFGFPQWTQILPGPFVRPKKPGLSKAKAFVRFWARSGEKLYLKIATDATNEFDDNDFNANSVSSSNVVTLTGTGSWTWASLADIPITRDRPFEHFAIYLRGRVTTTLGTSGGSPSSGTVTLGTTTTTISDPTTPATWNTTLTQNSWAETGHAITFVNAAGLEIVTARRIVAVHSATQLEFHPPIEGQARSQIFGSTYKIYELPRWRIGNIALYAQDRTA
jgi:hypothetical protein